MNDDSVKTVVDWGAGGVSFAVIMGFLPYIASMLTIVWFVIRIWESPTARRLLRAVCARCAAWWDAK